MKWRARSTAIAVNFPDVVLKASRKQAIVANATHVIFNRGRGTVTGIFYIDEPVLSEAGITNFDAYAVTPGATLYTDLFLE